MGREAEREDARETRERAKEREREDTFLKRTDAMRRLKFERGREGRKEGGGGSRDIHARLFERSHIPVARRRTGPKTNHSHTLGISESLTRR
jgi:hypothetical protein